MITGRLCRSRSGWLMIGCLNNLAVRQGDDPIEVPPCLALVTDGQHGAAAHQLIDRILNERFVFSIQAGSGFIKD